MTASSFILARRASVNALIERHTKIRNAFDGLAAISFILPDRVRRALVENFVRESCDYAEDDDCDFAGQAEAKLSSAGRVSIFDKTLLRLLCDHDVDYRNLSANIASIGDNIRVIDPLPVDRVPSLDGWLDSEIDTIIRSHDARIRRLTNDLRTIHRSVMRMRRLRAAIPPFLRDSVTGFFGTGDFIEDRYEDYEFKRYASVEARGEDGRIRFVDQRTPMMSTKWWYPLIGSTAQPIDGAIDVLFETSAPLSSEPPVDEFSSNTDIFSSETP